MITHSGFADLPISIASLPDRIGQTVTVSGWIHAVRRLAGKTFVILRDGGALAQVVVPASPIHFTPEMVVQISGMVVGEPRAPRGIEIHHPEVSVLASPAGPLPLSVSRPIQHTALNKRLDWAPLTLRRPEVRRWLQLADVLLSRFRAVLHELEFVEIHTPKITAETSEGGANVFAVDYFGQQAFLAQSPQLYKQMMVGVFGRVFEIGPVFRAEPHDTARHLSEYTSLDVEMGFIQDHRTVMELLRRVLEAMLEKPEGKWPEPWPKMPSSPPVVHFREALALLSDALGLDLSGEPDLSPAHEAWLGAWACEQFNSDFLFVEGYPARTRPFYTHPDPTDPKYTHSFDLLFRGQELVTGGQRLHLHHQYLGAMRQRGINPERFEPYLNAFAWGMPPHGGFAIGLERLIARIAGFSNIREATAFPRDMHRLEP